MERLIPLISEFQVMIFSQFWSKEGLVWWEKPRKLEVYEVDTQNA